MVNVNAFILLDSKYERSPYYNQLLTTISNLTEGVKSGSLNIEPGYILNYLKQVDVEECDLKYYNKVLNDLTDLIVDDFNLNYMELSYKQQVMNQFICDQFDPSMTKPSQEICDSFPKCTCSKFYPILQQKEGYMVDKLVL